jgi:membrane protease YdiL (CAAX protease family)
VHTLRDGIVALTLWVLAMVVEICLVLKVLPVPESFNPSNLGTPLAQLGLQPLAAVAALFLVVVSILYRRQPLKSIGWNRLTLRNGLLVGVALGFLTIFLRARFNALFAGLTPVQLNALWLVAVICLAEETVFRGFLQLRLAWWLGKPWGLLLTAGLFVLWRLPFFLSAPATLLANLVSTLVQGLLLGWIMQSCGNVAGPAIYRFISMWCNFL